MFHNLMRKAAKALYRLEKTKRNITYEILVAMLDFVNHLKKYLIEENIKINQNSLLFQFRNKILNYALVTKNIPEE